MANSFGTLYIGVSGLQSSQNALNITANNLANIDTVGYVRQQVQYADRDYVNLNKASAISKQQTGLGVMIGDVVHTRDIFLDRSYRTQSSRQAFYQACYDAAYEVETYFQEMEGQAFQGAMQDFWESFQELYKAPDDGVYQNLVIQKASLFLSRASAVYSGLQSYQYNINTQIRDDIEQVNDLGKIIYELNMEIQKIEAGGIETAMTLRDARDMALDELSALVDITYHETADGIVKVSVEGVEFVDEAKCYEMGMKNDKLTGFVTPYWPQLSNMTSGKYVNVFNFSEDISTENKNDMGELKALILARGDRVANYTDITGMNRDTYNDTTGMSVMLTAEAQMDQLIHSIVTALNDILAPNVEAGQTIEKLAGAGTTSITVTLADGTTRQIDADTKILDAENCHVGSDKQLPPRELFERIGTERYTEATYTDANGAAHTIYIYNEEDPNDTTMQYTLQSLHINQDLLEEESLLPHLFVGDYKVGYDLAAKLAAMWEEESTFLSPNDTKPCSFKDYYQSMIGEMATTENIFNSIATNLAATVASVDNQRQGVIGVSSDEELTYMIKYQNAYNASSRFINVVNEMIEHLLTSLG